MTIFSTKRLLMMMATLVTAVIFVQFFELKDIEEALREEALLSMFLLGLVFSSGYIFLDAFIFKLYLDFERIPMSFSRVLEMSLCGQFLGAVTPFQTGGQPMQYFLIKRHTSPRISIAIVYYNSLIYQIALVLLGAILAPLYARHEMGLWMVLTGWGINAAVLLMQLVCLYKVEWLISLVLLFMKKARHFHIKKNMLLFRHATMHMFKNHHLNLVGVLLNGARLMCLFISGYFAIAVFKVAVHWVDGLLTGAGAVLFSSMAPLPGGTGASEAGIMHYESSLDVPKNLQGASVLVWRVFSYYWILLVGFVAFIIYEARTGRKALAP